MTKHTDCGPWDSALWWSCEATAGVVWDDATVFNRKIVAFRSAETIVQRFPAHWRAEIVSRPRCLSSLLFTSKALISVGSRRTAHLLGGRLAAITRTQQDRASQASRDLTGSTRFPQPRSQTEQDDPAQQRNGHHNQSKTKEQLENDDRWQYCQSDQLADQSQCVLHADTSP
jgi:hypothetical protein